MHVNVCNRHIIYYTSVDPKYEIKCRQTANIIKYMLLGARARGVGASRIARPHLRTEMPGAMDLTKCTFMFSLFVATFSSHGHGQDENARKKTWGPYPPGCTHGHWQKQECLLKTRGSNPPGCTHGQWQRPECSQNTWGLNPLGGKHGHWQKPEGSQKKSGHLAAIGSKAKSSKSNCSSNR